MAEKKDLWTRLPKPNLDKKKMKRRMRKAEGATVRHAHKFIIKRWDNIRKVQRNVIIWVIAMGVLIAATGLQIMWNQQSYQASAAANNGIYAEGMLGPVDSLNPLFAKSSAEQAASYLMFSRILNYDKTGHLSYDLATNISVDSTNTVYTVTIRPDAKWQDGVRLTAKDIAFTVGLMQDPNTRTVYSGWSGISTNVINDTTIQFTLKSTFAPFEYALNFPILPEHLLKGVAPLDILGNSFSQNPVGSGPFKFDMIQDVDSTSDKKVIYLVRNDDYYGGTAKLARFQIHTYDSDDDIANALSGNEVNAATDLSSDDISSVNQSQYNIFTNPIQSGAYAILNTTSNILQDPVIRRALQVGTNTSAIRKQLPAGTPALWLPFTNGQLTGDVPSAPQYNPEAATQMLNQDGWKLNSKNIREKNGVELILSVAVVKDSQLEQILPVLTSQWDSLGIATETKTVDLTDVTQGDVQNILQPRNYDVLLYQLNIGADPDVYAYWDSSQATMQGMNYANYSNLISNEALESARAVVDPALRNAKYIAFANQWLSDVPAIGLYQATTQYVVSKNAQAFDSSNKLVSPVDRYSDVLNWSVGSHIVYKTP
jgi:peptide/nickel transport system substrate-binding protein